MDSEETGLRCARQNDPNIRAGPAPGLLICLQSIFPILLHPFATEHQALQVGPSLLAPPRVVVQDASMSPERSEFLTYAMLR